MSVCARIDFAAKRFANGLVAEANAQNRRLPRHVPDERHQNSRLMRRAGARRKQNPLRLHGLNLLRRYLVVAPHHDLRAQLAQVLNEVVGEGVVVVENEDHVEFQCSALRGYIRRRNRSPRRALQRIPAKALYRLRALARICNTGLGPSPWFFISSFKAECRESASAGLCSARPLNLSCADGCATLRMAMSRSWRQATPVTSTNCASSLRRGPRGARVDRIVEHSLAENEASRPQHPFQIDGAW
jgi:hypothetical protein